MNLADRFAEASALLEATRDIVEERSTGLASPSWCVARDWSDRLAALGDEELVAIEREGLCEGASLLPDLPGDLASLSRQVKAIVSLPRLALGDALDVEARRAAPRKRAQVAAFAELARELAPFAARIVDVGSGHGHLTRHLAGALRLETEGWERDAERVEVARSLGSADGPRFRAVDVRESGGEIRASDLVVGLHACGELSDLATTAAAQAGSSIVLVGCCLQKRAGDRAPLSIVDEPRRRALTLGRAVLGLANARDGEEGVEEDLATRALSRERRLALRSLLRSAGLSIEAGAEMRGINRRRATGTLETLVALAFTSRNLPLPSPRAIEEAARTAHRESHRARRWELPRTMLARLIEVWVALDRAMKLAENGRSARVVIAFPRATSPRNLAVVSRGML